MNYSHLYILKRQTDLSVHLTRDNFGIIYLKELNPSKQHNTMQHRQILRFLLVLAIDCTAFAANGHNLAGN